jgi:hypothetical protein
VREQRQVVRQLLVLRHDDALAAGIEAGPARAAKYLLHVQDAQVSEPAALWIIQLSALDLGAYVKIQRRT